MKVKLIEDPHIKPLFCCKCFSCCLASCHHLIAQIIRPIWSVNKSEHGDGSCHCLGGSFVKPSSPPFPLVKRPVFQRETFLLLPLGHCWPAPLWSLMISFHFNSSWRNRGFVYFRELQRNGLNWGSRSRHFVVEHFQAVRLRPHQHFWTAVWRLTGCLRKKLVHFLLR